jgi:hypothetical protein
MTLLTDNLALPCSVSSFDGSGDGERTIAAAVLELDFDFEQPWQWTEFCYACNRDATFQVLGVAANGLLVRCKKCLDERIAPDTRTM